MLILLPDCQILFKCAKTQGIKKLVLDEFSAAGIFSLDVFSAKNWETIVLWTDYLNADAVCLKGHGEV